jgi:hypothetical protein
MKTILLLFIVAGCGRELVAETENCSDQLECLAPDGVSECVNCQPTCQVDYLPTEDQRHLETEVDYPVYPPAGGAHNPCWYDFGVFDYEIPEERWVHNQEHGAVVFLYNCPEGCDGELQALIDMVSPLERVILSPYSKMRWRFAATAWEHRIMMNCLDLDRMQQFYDRRFNKAPEDVASMPSDNCMEAVNSSEGSDTAEDSGSR